jgi:predicted nucleic acid-binding protein
MILLDANILFDIWDPDPVWCAWSTRQLKAQSQMHDLAINPIVYSEISVSFAGQTEVDDRLEAMEIGVLDIPRAAAFLAGKAYVHFRRKGGTKTNVLPDFFVGAHAAVLGCSLLTRDTRRYSTYFPTVRLISP